jgi:3-methylcrotonyl-CoA carboxylase alpha subunit
MFSSVLIANRGEIACRVIRTARRLGLRSIAVYSDADREARHVRLADQAIRIGPAPARESYLSIDAILAAAEHSGAECIHPGYGFLSENAEFAARCAAAGRVFVGPPIGAIEQMGSKSQARQLMARSGVPVLPGYDGADQRPETLRAEAARLGYPLLIKPTAGGGGKGMRIVRDAAHFDEACAGAKREAAKSFGDDRLLLERFVEVGRHVEIQVFADRHSHALHLFERDCSLQRRHQKVIEEAPAPSMADATRDAMGGAAVAAAHAVHYEGAGTVEFLYDGREFYFLEMNTRLQVEHPVTEMITGLDLVEWQLRVAAGEPLPLDQWQISHRGHAVEARLYAEDPERGFLPSTGTLRRLRWPATTEHLRIDTGVEEGDSVTVHYDPMIAKLIAWGADRATAIARLRAALERVEVDGVRTNARFLWDVLGDERVANGEVSTRLLEQRAPTATEPLQSERRVAWLLAIAAQLGLPDIADSPTPVSPWSVPSGYRPSSAPTIRLSLRCDDEAHWIAVERRGDAWVARLGDRSHRIEHVRLHADRIKATIDGAQAAAGVVRDAGRLVLLRNCLHYEFTEDAGAEHRASVEHEGHLRAPMPGHVLDVRVAKGQQVAQGTVLIVLEAMKMEHSLTAPWDAIVDQVAVQAGARVEEGADLVQLVPAVPADAPATSRPA